MRLHKVSPLVVGLAAVGLLAGAGILPARAEYQPKGKRDPFMPLVNQQGHRVHPPGSVEADDSGLGNLVLQGIVFDPKRESYAVISGQVVRELEEIEGVRVVKIEPDAVTVEVEGETRRLTVQELEEEETLTKEKKTP
ncbi:MAG: hypothetical protein HYZ94_03130 [Candidatus Omnitrophica bacterium]|nr:hypothetical protein [Candidatus Omnitrophota bacterium]